MLMLHTPVVLREQQGTASDPSACFSSVPNKSSARYKCNVNFCHRSFQRPYNLKRHLETVHNVAVSPANKAEEQQQKQNKQHAGAQRSNSPINSEEHYTCYFDFCHKTFQRAFNLKRHLKLVHQVEKIDSFIAFSNSNNAFNLNLSSYDSGSEHVISGAENNCNVGPMRAMLLHNISPPPEEEEEEKKEVNGKKKEHKLICGDGAKLSYILN